MTEFKEALIKFQGFDKTFDDEETFQLDSQTILTIRRALLLADKLMQEPSRAMEEIGSGNGRPRLTGWKKPLRPGMRVACTTYDEYERAANCFKDMRDQLIKEIDNANQ